MSLNQHLSQLSSAYLTIFKNGGEVTVRLEEKGLTVQAKGFDTDIVVASAKAYVNAINKLMIKRNKSAPDEVSKLKIIGV